MLTMLLSPIAFAQSNATDLLMMTDQLDQLDTQDFQESIDKTKNCTRSRSFSCADSELAKASKLAKNSTEKQLLADSRKDLKREKELLANEIRIERERLLAEERREEARQARLEREEREEQQARDRQTSRDTQASFNQFVQRLGAQNAAVLNNANRQVNSAYAETNRRLAAQAEERNHAQAQRDAQWQEQRASQAKQQQRQQQVAQADTATEADRDIHEAPLDFQGRLWMEGGGSRGRRPVSTRGEACQQAERDREETIALNTRDMRDRGVERRSKCHCSYSAGTKLWYCKVYFLPVGHSAGGVGNR